MNFKIKYLLNCQMDYGYVQRVLETVPQSGCQIEWKYWWNNNQWQGQFEWYKIYFIVSFCLLGLCWWWVSLVVTRFICKSIRSK